MQKIVSIIFILVGCFYHVDALSNGYYIKIISNKTGQFHSAG